MSEKNGVYNFFGFGTAGGSCVQLTSCHREVHCYEPRTSDLPGR